MSKEFLEVFVRYGGVEIIINKYIFMVVGLVGGLINVAVVLVGLDLMWELGLIYREL